MGVGFQIPIKNLVSILISTAVKTARVVSLSGLKPVSFPLTEYSYEYVSRKGAKAQRIKVAKVKFSNFILYSATLDSVLMIDIPT
jgi:Na+-transporting NADH:ubiquinone oxidoreductase subunit NqrE